MSFRQESSRITTPSASLQRKHGKLPHQQPTKRPVDEGAASRNANDVLMLRAKLKSLEERAVIANKSVLEAEKEGTSFTRN